jgi:hypothetical protein
MRRSQFFRVRCAAHGRGSNLSGGSNIVAPFFVSQPSSAIDLDLSDPRGLPMAQNMNHTLFNTGISAIINANDAELGHYNWAGRTDLATPRLT